MAASAMERTIDEVVARYGGSLSLLCFGYELDRYAARASSAERQGLVAAVTHAVDYAKRHAPRARTGVAVTLDALASPEAAAVDDLRLGDTVVAVYDPFDAAGQLKVPGSITQELAAALATVEQRDDTPRPLALFEVGYPSASAAGASEQAQREYYAALFAALDSERDAVEFVGVYGLGDRAEPDCEAEMAAFGEATGPSETPEPSEPEAALLSVRAFARCSMGLRAENRAPKLAWQGVLGALSRYAR
jgi:hypothetical protein